MDTLELKEAPIGLEARGRALMVKRSATDWVFGGPQNFMGMRKVNIGDIMLIKGCSWQLQLISEEVLKFIKKDVKSVSIGAEKHLLNHLALLKLLKFNFHQAEIKKKPFKSSIKGVVHLQLFYIVGMGIKTFINSIPQADFFIKSFDKSNCYNEHLHHYLDQASVIVHFCGSFLSSYFFPYCRKKLNFRKTSS